MKKRFNLKKTWKKIWYFIWEDNSVWSWIVNILLAFVIIKYLVYPGLGLVLATSHPVVAVISNSMEHEQGLDKWLELNEDYYLQYNITKDDFYDFNLKRGFNKGDIIVLYGKKPKDINIGDVIVFRSGRPDPIIHRVIKKWDVDGEFYFHTKGDHNSNSIAYYVDLAGRPVPKGTPNSIEILDETNIPQDKIIGKAAFKVPFLGWIKIGFVEAVQFVAQSLNII